MSPIPQEHVDLIIRIAHIEAWNVVKRSGNKNYVEVDDLVQVGCEAGVAAYCRWDPDRSKLVTFILYRIRGGIADYLRGEDHLTRNQRKAVKAGEAEDHIHIFSWEEYVVHDVEPGYEEIENHEVLLTVVSRYRGECCEAVKAWVRLNGNLSQRDIAKAFGVHESALSRGIKQLMKDAPTLLDQETP